MPHEVSEDTLKKLLNEGKFLVRDINGKTINGLISWFMNNRPQKSKFTILINSSGGSPGLVAYTASVLKTMKSDFHLTGVAFGECGSAALALLQCCNERVVIKHTGLFVHNIEDTFQLSSQTHDLNKVKTRLGISRNLENELIELQRKRCGMTRAQWMKLAKRGQDFPGTAIFPKEAKKLGLIDQIVESYPIF